MSDYIKRRDAMMVLGASRELTEGMRSVLMIPSADVVEVVRCKDCIYNSCSPDNGNACCDMFYGMTDQMGFCHYGERKEKENE